ncbi:MAG: hypothetical protein JNM27_09620 [Leptospirales bacterium]|nr:hypothetical protein [Leptospirales bacterium]
MTEILSQSEIEALIAAINAKDDNDSLRTERSLFDRASNNRKPNELLLDCYTAIHESNATLSLLLENLCGASGLSKPVSKELQEEFQQAGMLSRQSCQNLTDSLLAGQKEASKERQGDLLSLRQALLNIYFDIDFLTHGHIEAIYLALDSPPAERKRSLIHMNSPAMIQRRMLSFIARGLRSELHRLSSVLDHRGLLDVRLAHLEELTFEEYWRSVPAPGTYFYVKGSVAQVQFILDFPNNFLNTIWKSEPGPLLPSTVAAEDSKQTARREKLLPQLAALVSAVLADQNVSPAWDPPRFEERVIVGEYKSNTRCMVIFFEHASEDTYFSLTIPVHDLLEALYLSRRKQHWSREKAFEKARRVAGHRMEQSTKTSDVIQAQVIDNRGWAFYFESPGEPFQSRRWKIPPVIINKHGKIFKHCGLRSRLQEDVDAFAMGHPRSEVFEVPTLAYLIALPSDDATAG